MAAIVCEGIWKQYRYGKIGYGTLRSDLQSWWARVRGREDPNTKIDASLKGADREPGAERFWALEDVSFDVEPGEVVGVIGRNGAGKSTLLKVLSRVTSPTLGEVRVRGRLASLLEVGTGFHPDLTGRENVFLNGAILGMTRAEISRKLDEIVVFSGLERFIDTPVKRYSSGMYVRLAFSIAAHLEPEILLVDEVLAVGDAEFQARCLGKMEDVSRHGRTILFVSHNLNAVENLCSRVVWLDGGGVKDVSRDVRGVIDAYLSAGNPQVINGRREVVLPRSYWADIVEFSLVGAGGTCIIAPVRNDDSLSVQITVDIKQCDPALNFGFAIYDHTDDLLFWSLSTDARRDEWPRLELGRNTLQCALPSRLLNEGVYTLHMIASLHNREWLARPKVDAPVLRLEIRGGLSDSPYWTGARPGRLAPHLRWRAIDQGEHDEGEVAHAG